MIRNYLKTAISHLRRNPVFSFINVVGLAIGISAALVIFLIANFDFGFDRFERDGDRIYRVVSNMKFPDKDFKNSGVPLPLIPAVAQSISGIDLLVPFTIANKTKVAVVPATGSQEIIYKKQKGIIYTTSEYFKLLGYDWVVGSPELALKEPSDLVLTESRARTYFPRLEFSQMIGRVVTYNDTQKVVVRGIVRELKGSTDFTFKDFISFGAMPKDRFEAPQWGSVSSSDQLLIKLGKGHSPVQVNRKIQELFNTHQEKDNLNNIFSLQPLSDIHFNAEYDNFDQRLAHRPTLYGLLITAAILLLLGAINFINLTTAQAVKRAKEIGIRKTMGSSRRQLVIQFLGETFLLTVLATLLSIVLIPWIIRLFAGFIPPEINFGMLNNGKTILFIFLLMSGVSLLAGFYPALILSGFNPVKVLKNQVSAGSGSGRSWIRKSLTVTQFVFAQAFLIAAIVVSHQIQYMMEKDLGFRKEGIVILETPFNFTDFYSETEAKKSASKREALLRKLEAIPGFELGALGGESPASGDASMQTMKYNDGKRDLETTVEIRYAEPAYFRLYDIKLVAGRYLRQTDTLAEYVITENYARFLGFRNPADAIGKSIGPGSRNYPIVGVVHDFYSHSQHSPIKPLVFYCYKVAETRLHISLSPAALGGQWAKTRGQFQQAFKEFYPDEEFNLNFFDDSLARFYDNEHKTSILLLWATGLAIVISCLGLLGLAIYTTNQRQKEIGVRKVLGASVWQIVNLVSGDFLKLVALAFMIAVPLVWWGVHEWFKNFTYHARVGVWLYAGAGLLMLLVAIISLSVQTIRAASANPVTSLRNE